MTSREALRGLALAPSLVLMALLMTACATAPARPPAPISSGEPRVDPSPQRPGDEATDTALDPGEIEFGEIDMGPQPLDDGLTPPHMVGREVQRAAVLLPFSHPSREVRNEAQGMLAAIEMALFDHGGEGFLVMPKDTAGTEARASSEAEAALEERADIILGPLFSANVRAVTPIAEGAGVPVIAFSNDPAAAGQGAWLASVAVEEEVRRVVEYASTRGIDTYAFLGPRSDYGRRVEAALRQAVAREGGALIGTQFYDPANEAPVDEAQDIASLVAAETQIRPNRVAVMIPERGVKLRAVAPLLPYYGVDIRRMTFLGTSVWDDPGVWREPTLDGALFASAAPEDTANFAAAYERIYGRAPTRLASLGYDAAAMAIRLAADDALDTRGVTSPSGFRGINGLFRLRLDGSVQRSLSVLEIDTEEGAQLVSPGASSFGPGG